MKGLSLSICRVSLSVSFYLIVPFLFHRQAFCLLSAILLSLSHLFFPSFPSLFSFLFFLQEYKVDRRELMYKLCDSFAYQIHIDGLFNGDPHPGNILVQIDEETGDATPVILDWGLVKTFDSKGQLAFSKLVRNLSFFLCFWNRLYESVSSWPGYSAWFLRDCDLILYVDKK